MSEFVTPASLDPGDKVAIVAPSSGVRIPHVYETGLDRLHSTFNLESIEFPTATKSDEFLDAKVESTGPNHIC